MEAKKNPKIAAGRNSSIYFAVGLVLTLLISNYSINYKTYDKDLADLGVLTMGELEDEEIPITKQFITPPPPPPPPPVTLPEDPEIVDDEKDVVETVMGTTDTDEEEKVVDIKDVDVEDVDEDIEVPFVLIEKAPVYPGCDQGTNAQKKQCMSEKITKLIQKKFNTELAENLGLSGKQRISVMFKIDKQGNIVEVRSRAPHPRLEKEAARVINLLPKMKPGEQRGKTVTVSYSLPIIFQVQD